MKNCGGKAICLLTMHILAICGIAVLMLMGDAMGEISRTGLVAEYHFDGDAKDSSGNGNDGVSYGTTFGEGKFGKGMSFDGVNDYVEISNSVDLNPTNAITVEAWTYWNFLGNRSVGIVGKGEESSQTGWALGKLWSGTKLRFYPRGDFGAFAVEDFGETQIRIPTYQWVHYVASYNGSVIRMYVNGVLDNQVSSGGLISTNTQPIVIGKWYGNSENYFFDGFIDEVRLYNRALSADEVKANYEAGQIIITSSPSGAEVFINGQSKETASPTLIVSGLSIGTYEVKCKLIGYSDYDANVLLTASSSASVNCQLNLEPAPTLSPITTTTLTTSTTAPTTAPPEIRTTSPTTIATASNTLTPAPAITSTPVDSSPPSISISKQNVDFNKNDQLDEGEKVVITYGANDESGVKSIKILLDENLIELRNNEGIYSVTTDSLSIGSHSIVIDAIDSKGNKKSEEMIINAARAGPSVYFPKSRYEVNEGEDINVVLSAVNPIGNPKMNALLILKPPGNGISTYESDCKGFSGQCTGKFEIEPGDSIRSVSARMRADKKGEYYIDAEVYYQFENGERSPTRYDTLNIVVKPKPPIPKAQGFELILAGFGIVLALVLRNR